MNSKCSTQKKYLLTRTSKHTSTWLVLMQTLSDIIAIVFRLNFKALKLHETACIYTQHDKCICICTDHDSITITNAISTTTTFGFCLTNIFSTEATIFHGSPKVRADLLKVSKNFVLFLVQDFVQNVCRSCHATVSKH